jgi:hypothetical protein
LFLGIELDSLGSFETQALTQVIARKVPGFGVGFPRKRRRGEIETGPEPATEAEEILPPPEAEEAMDALIVDQQVGRISALDMIQNLRNAGRLTSAKDIVLKGNEDVKLKVAERVGGVDLTVSHPVDFDGVLKPELERLLGIT